MRLEIDIAAQARNPLIAGLDLTALQPDDLQNLILQRSEVLFDLPHPGQIIKAWNAGDAGPLRQVVETMGDTIARRAAAVIHAEYRALAPLLRDLAPGRIADIGCGYGFFDLFVARDLGAEVVLIDLESNERRHFGYQPEGAAYSSLGVARKLLESNGIAASAIRTLNPRDEAAEAIAPVDLAVSFLSCGFHYPVSTYATFLDKAVTPDGAVIVDLRAATADEQAETLARLGSLHDLPAPPKARRVLLRKGRV